MYVRAAVEPPLRAALLGEMLGWYLSTVPVLFVELMLPCKTMYPLLPEQ